MIENRGLGGSKSGDPGIQLTIQDRVRRQLAADYACEVEHLKQDGIVFVESRRMPGRRRFPWREKRIGLVTLGRGVVVCCDAGRLEWARESLGERQREELFSAENLARLQEYVAADGQTMHGPVLKFVCSRERLRAAPQVSGSRCEIYEGERVKELYSYEEFTNALGYARDPARPDVLVCVARSDDRIVGMAGAGADSEEFWQIGVDVLPEFRGRGLALLVVSQVARAVMCRGKVPYYSTAPSHLASINVALRVGFWPTWLELEARDPRPTSHSAASVRAG